MWRKDMVLFLCIFAGVVILAVCLLWRITLRFRVQMMDAHLLARAEIRLLFGLIRIPVGVDTSIAALLRGKREKEKKKESKRKSLLRGLLRQGRKTGALRLTEFNCRGLVGYADDAFFSVMAAGTMQITLELLLRMWLFPRSARISITPSFERNALWIYMEGILEIVPTQIIGILIRNEKARRDRKHDASD